MQKSRFSFPSRWKFVLFTIILFSNLFIFYWRIIALQNFAVFCRTSTSFKLKIICTFYTNSNMHIYIYIYIYFTIWAIEYRLLLQRLKVNQKKSYFPLLWSFLKNNATISLTFIYNETVWITPLYIFSMLLQIMLLM